MEYVYRLLRPEENYENGIRAKNPNSSTSVFRHVLGGSWGPTSKYISTCGSLQALRDFASKSRRPGEIIKIKIDMLPENVEIIDLRDYLKRMEYIEHTNDEDEIRKFNNFANKFEEVLLAGCIPASCIELV
ncbi:uncharacterized protein LOC134702100 [Mytilus trossulus]|uniref:uncharacterized protein LOC134702100 n=1 Tax=Mytilus trossulus TaxID=6551 RepID=UPI0030072689